MLLRNKNITIFVVTRDEIPSAESLQQKRMSFLLIHNIGEQDPYAIVKVSLSVRLKLKFSVTAKPPWLCFSGIIPTGPVGD